jgi:molybdenum cofactor cytidylyltransferase
MPENPETNSKIGLIILAAGSSTRLGMPKQSVIFHGQTLLQKIARESLKSDSHPAIIVLGKNAQEFRQSLENSDVRIIENKDWEQGMGTSISCGVKALTELDKDLKGIVLCVCDQPFVTAAVINDLISEFLHRQSKIVASSYAETLGVPALFDRSLFPELIDLRGKSGAKKLIERYKTETSSIDFPDGKFDIDTQKDVEELREME